MAAPSGLIVAWPSTVASIPSGWTRYTTLDARVPKPSTSSIGTQLGLDTHGHSVASHNHSDHHTHTATSGNSAGTSLRTTGGSQDSTDQHTHTYPLGGSFPGNSGAASGTSSSGSSTGYPRYSVIWIQSNGTTDIPVGAVAWSNQGTVPANWQAHAASVNHYLRGATAGGNGGTATAAAGHSHTYAHTHTHSTAAHTHANGGTSNNASQGTTQLNAGSGDSTNIGSHNHTMSGTSGSASHNAATSGSDNASASTASDDLAYYKLQHVAATAQVATPGGIIALWTTTSPPTGWNACDGSNGTPNINGQSRYIKGAANTGEIGSAGGVNDHTHTIGHTHAAAASVTGVHAVGSVSLAARATSGILTVSGSGSATMPFSTHTHAGGNSSAIQGPNVSENALYGASNHEPANVAMFFIMASLSTTHTAAASLAGTSGATGSGTVMSPVAYPTNAVPLDDFSGGDDANIDGRLAPFTNSLWQSPMPGHADIVPSPQPLAITGGKLHGTHATAWSSAILSGAVSRASAPVEIYATHNSWQTNLGWLISTPGVGTTNGYMAAITATDIQVYRIDNGVLTLLATFPVVVAMGWKVGIRHAPGASFDLIGVFTSRGTASSWYSEGAVSSATYTQGQFAVFLPGDSNTYFIDDLSGTMPPGVITASASIAGTSAVAATGQQSTAHSGQASLAGAGVLGATATYTHAAAAGLTGLGAVAATGTQNSVRFAVASLAGLGQVGPTGTVIFGTGKATILGTSSLAGVNSTVTRHGAAGLAGAGAVTATGGYLRLGAAGITGTSSLTATPRKDVPGAASLAGQGALNASGLLIHTATAQLTGTGLVSATGREIFAARVTVTGQGTLGPTATVDSLAYASIQGVGTLIATALVIRPQAPMRIRLEVRDPAGNLLNSGPFLEALQASYEQALDQVGSFEVTIPATSRRAAMFTHANQVDIYREGEGLVFRGIIEHLRQEGGPDNEPTILVSGGSTARKGLVHLKTGRDRNFEGATLATIVSTLLSGSGYTAGTVDVPAVLATMTTTASRWAALVRAAELFGIHAREDVLASQVDVSAFGTVRSLRLVTATGVSPSLLDSPNVAVIASVDVEEDSSEIANKLYGLGGGEGVNVLHLGYGDRASPYAIQSEAGPTYTEYFLRDAASATAYGERQKYVSVADLMPLANSSAGFLAAANSLYDILVDEMLRWKDPLREYQVGVADLKHLDAAGAYRFEVGDKLPVWARGMVRRSDGAAAWLDLDTSLWVTAYRRTFTATGADNWQLTLANVDRHGQDLSQKISEVISDVEALKVAHKPYTYDRSAGPYRNSVDASNALPFSILFDANTYLIHKSNLTFRVRGVRSNSTTASSGGSATSGSGSSHTHTITATSSGAGTTHSHSLAGATTNPSGDFVVANWVITSTAPAGLTGIETAFVAGHQHNVVATNRQLSLDTHTHTFSGAVAANEASHTHSVGGGTSGADASHTHTTPNHTHPLTYGIFQATTPASPAVGITINGVSRTVALGGPWNSGVTLDITQYLQGANGQPLRQDNAIILSAGVLCDIEVEVHTLATATSLIPV